MVTLLSVGHAQYLVAVQHCRDEVMRLNADVDENGGTGDLKMDSTRLMVEDEFRFVLLRHWTLYDAMFYSSYVACRLGVWRERGAKRLAQMLALMG